MQFVGCVFLAAYAIAQVVAAFWGLEAYVGWLAVPLIALCLYFRFSLPVTVCAFLGAKNYWGWHWLVALIFVAPGLLLIVPAVLSSVVQTISTSVRREAP
jgi:hypothetical protein